jgi:hypothetical protein
MDLLTKYKWFKKGIVTRNTSVKLQHFFKTEPTEEQLMMLDDIDKDNTMVIILMFLFMFVYGFLFGLFWVYMKYKLM